MIRSWPSVLIGLFVPASALLVGILVLSGSTASVLGVPVLFFWVFCCCPLTTLCLWISWRFFDRAHYPEDD